jgi:chromosome segregation ATPase
LERALQDAVIALHACRLKSLGEKVSELESKLADSVGVHAAINAKSEELDASKEQYRVLLKAHEAIKLREDEMMTTIAALRADCDTSRSAAASASKELVISNQSAVDLQAALSSMQERLDEAKSKDIQVYSRIREAMEAAEQVLFALFKTEEALFWTV